MTVGETPPLSPTDPPPPLAHTCVRYRCGASTKPTTCSPTVTFSWTCKGQNNNGWSDDDYSPEQCEEKFDAEATSTRDVRCRDDEGNNVPGSMCPCPQPDNFQDYVYMGQEYDGEDEDEDEDKGFDMYDAYVSAKTMTDKCVDLKKILDSYATASCRVKTFMKIDPTEGMIDVDMGSMTGELTLSDDKMEPMHERECFDKAAFEAAKDDPVPEFVMDDAVHPAQAELCGECSGNFQTALQEFASAGCFARLFAEAAEAEEGDGDGVISATEAEDMGLVILFGSMLILPHFTFLPFRCEMSCEGGTTCSNLNVSPSVLADFSGDSSNRRLGTTSSFIEELLEEKNLTFRDVKAAARMKGSIDKKGRALAARSRAAAHKSAHKVASLAVNGAVDGAVDGAVASLKSRIPQVEATPRLRFLQATATASPEDSGDNNDGPPACAAASPCYAPPTVNIPSGMCDWITTLLECDTPLCPDEPATVEEGIAVQKCACENIGCEEDDEDNGDDHGDSNGGSSSSVPCEFVINNFNSDGETLVGHGLTPDECIALVKEECPTATIANMPADDSNNGACFCQFGDDFSANPSETWMNWPMLCELGDDEHHEVENDENDGPPECLMKCFNEPESPLAFLNQGIDGATAIQSEAVCEFLAGDPDCLDISECMIKDALTISMVSDCSCMEGGLTGCFAENAMEDVMSSSNSMCLTLCVGTMTYPDCEVFTDLDQIQALGIEDVCPGITECLDGTITDDLAVLLGSSMKLQAACACDPDCEMDNGDEDEDHGDDDEDHGDDNVGDHGGLPVLGEDPTLAGGCSCDPLYDSSMCPKDGSGEPSAADLAKSCALANKMFEEHPCCYGSYMIPSFSAFYANFMLVMTTMPQEPGEEMMPEGSIPAIMGAMMTQAANQMAEECGFDGHINMQDKSCSQDTCPANGWTPTPESDKPENEPVMVEIVEFQVTMGFSLPDAVDLSNEEEKTALKGVLSASIAEVAGVCESCVVVDDIKMSEGRRKLALGVDVDLTIKTPVAAGSGGGAETVAALDQLLKEKQADGGLAEACVAHAQQSDVLADVIVEGSVEVQSVTVDESSIDVSETEEDVMADMWMNAGANGNVVCWAGVAAAVAGAAAALA